MKCDAQLLVGIYDAALNNDHWEEVLDGTALLVGGAGVAITSVEVEQRYQFNINYFNSFYDLEFISEYMQKFAIYEQAVYEDIMSKAHSNEIHYDPLSESNRAAFDRRPDIIWLKEKFNIYERFGVRLSDNPSRCDLLAITYDASRGNVSNKEEAALMEIVPHLSQALCISTTFSILRARYKAALAAIEKIRIGIFLLDIDGHIIFDNQTARNLVDSKTIFNSFDGKLTVGANGDKCRFSLLVKEAAATAVGENSSSGGTMVVRSIESKKDFIVDISPVRDSPNELGEKFKGALVSIIDPDYSERLDVKCLKNLYLLTEAELDILQHVIDGYSNVQISQIRSVSPETVKKQVSNVLLKVGARGRTQLVRKVLSVILPLDI